MVHAVNDDDDDVQCQERCNSGPRDFKLGRLSCVSTIIIIRNAQSVFCLDMDALPRAASGIRMLPVEYRLLLLYVVIVPLLQARSTVVKVLKYAAIIVSLMRWVK